MWRLGWAFVLLAACHADPRAPAEIRATSPLPTSTAGSAACPVDVVTVARVERDDVVLEAIARNVSTAPVEVELPDRCPRGRVAFDGFGDAFDYEDACARGACLGPRTPERVRLTPGERARIASTVVALHRSSCHAAVGPGHHVVRAVVPAVDARCVQAASFDVAGSAAPATSGGDRACTTSADCTIFCPSAPGCCGDPCGCRNAVRRDRVAALAASFPKACTRPPHCPAMGCAYEPAMSAVCRDGVCRATSGVGF